MLQVAAKNARRWCWSGGSALLTRGTRLVWTLTIVGVPHVHYNMMHVAVYYVTLAIMDYVFI